MEIFLFWFLFSVAVGIYAGNKGRSGFGFFLLSILLSPLLGLLFAAAAENLVESAEKPTPETHVRCPDCRELILIGARVCKHCGCKIKPQE